MLLLTKKKNMDESSINKKKWIPTTERFVAFIDIMGFKDMVMRSSHNEIYNLLNELYSLRKSINNVRKLPEQYELDSLNSLKTVSFSDSIIFFTKSSSIECFSILTRALSWLFAKSIEKGLPMKGAISFGEISVNIKRQIFFGQPLIDAILLGEDVNYYGVVAHHSVEKYLNKNEDELSKFGIRDYYFEEQTPFKSGKISHINLNWFFRVDNDSNENIPEKVEDLMKKQREKTSGSPRIYIDNTLNLFNNNFHPK